MRNPVETYMRQFVCVEASGIRYFGTLIEIGEDEVILQSKTRWLSVPVDKVSRIELVDPAQLETVVESVDADAYAPDEGPGDDVAAEPPDGSEACREDPLKGAGDA